MRAGAELIVVEAPPDMPEWSGIADRCGAQRRKIYRDVLQRSRSVKNSRSGKNPVGA